MIVSATNPGAKLAPKRRPKLRRSAEWYSAATLPSRANGAVRHSRARRTLPVYLSLTSEALASELTPPLDHMQRHQNRKEHICSLSDCVSRFNTRSDLERHTRVVHKRYLRRYIAYAAYESLAHHPQKQLCTRPTTALKTEDMAFADSGGTPWPLHRAHSQ